MVYIYIQYVLSFLWHKLHKNVIFSWQNSACLSLGGQYLLYAYQRRISTEKENFGLGISAGKVCIVFWVFLRQVVYQLFIICEVERDTLIYRSFVLKQSIYQLILEFGKGNVLVDYFMSFDTRSQMSET